MNSIEKEENQKSFPVCRVAMLAAAVVITLTAAVSGLEPYDIFIRVVMGSIFVGVVMFFVNLWFSTLFL